MKNRKNSAESRLHQASQLQLALSKITVAPVDMVYLNLLPLTENATSSSFAKRSTNQIAKKLLTNKIQQKAATNSNFLESLEKKVKFKKNIKDLCKDAIGNAQIRCAEYRNRVSE